LPNRKVVSFLPARRSAATDGIKAPDYDQAMSEAHTDLVTVKHLSNPAIAKLVAQILLAENIPAFVNGAELMDEFAISQMLLGAVACEVQVPQKYEKRAREVLAAAKEAGKRLTDTEDWKEGDRDRGE